MSGQYDGGWAGKTLVGCQADAKALVRRCQKPVRDAKGAIGEMSLGPASKDIKSLSGDVKGLSKMFSRAVSQMFTGDVTSPSGDVAACQGDVKPVRRRKGCPEMTGAVREHPSETSRACQGDVWGLSGDVKGLSGDVRGLSVDVRGPSEDVKGLSGDVRGLSGDVRGLSGDVRGCK